MFRYIFPFLLVLMVGCTKQADVDYNPLFKTGSLSTFAIVRENHSAISSLNEERMNEAIENNMQQKGYLKVPESTANFQISYRVKIQQDTPSNVSVGLGLGCICSTAGGIKMLRVGIIFKAFKEDIKRIIMPEKAIIIEKFHHIKDVFLEDKLARGALTITFAYIILYLIGSLVGMFYGYPFLEALFESTSAAANVGLSCGITSAGMPKVLEITYIMQMWAGRLEFMSVFTIIGFLAAAIKGRK